MKQIKKKEIFVLMIVLVFLMASVARSQAVVERYRLGNSYIEGISFISEGKLSGKFAFADGWSVYTFDIQTGTYEKLFSQGNLPIAMPAWGMCFISKGNFAGNFLLAASTLFIMSSSGTLISEVAPDFGGDWYQTEGITEITSGPYQGKFAAIVFKKPSYAPHIIIFRIEDIGGTVNAYLEKDIGPANLGVYPCGICFLPNDYPDPAYRNHFVLSDLEVEPDSGGRYLRIIDENGFLKAKFLLDSPSEGLAYINKGQYMGKLMLYDMGSLLAWVRNLNGTEKVSYDLGVGLGLSVHLLSLTWLSATNQFMLGRWLGEPNNAFYFVSRLGPENWRRDDEIAYSGIPRLRDVTELTPEGNYYLLGIKWDGSWKRWVQKLDSHFNLQEEYPIWEYSDKSFWLICYIPGDTPELDKFALVALNTRNIYLFNKDFSSYEIVDLSGKVDNITDICYEAAIQKYCLLDSGNLIRIFDSYWNEIDQCDVSNLAPPGFSSLTKMTSGDLRDHFALLNRNDLEIVIINFQNQKAVSQLENLIEEIQASSIQQGLTIQERSVEDELETSLIKKLKNAINSIELGNINAAIHEIMAFQNEVQAQEGKKIPADLADDWINKAEQIIQILRD